MKHEEEGKSLAKMSPFGIQKALDMITTGIIKTQRTQAGDLLILAKNGMASNALLKTTKLGQLAPVKVIEHPTLNSSKGIVYCRDLIDISEEEILAGLAEQGVVEVRKIKRWVEKELRDTPSLVLTFNTPALPDFITAGFIKLNIRLYIPNPMRCTNCFKFGHTKKRCTSRTLCIKCGEGIPHETECTIIKCVNCKEEHLNNSKQCLVYKRETAIIKIKTEKRLTFHEAKTKYYRMYANTTPSVSYVDTLKNSKETTKPQQQQKQGIQVPQSMKPEQKEKQHTNNIQQEQTTKNIEINTQQILNQQQPKQQVQCSVQQTKTTTNPRNLNQQQRVQIATGTTTTTTTKNSQELRSGQQRRSSILLNSKEMSIVNAIEIED